MKFRSLQVYQYTLDCDLESIEPIAQKRAFMTCGPFEKELWTWTSPYGRGSDTVVRMINQYLVLTLEKQNRILPTDVIMQEAFDRQKQAAEDNEKIQKKYIHQATEYLLPKAFIKKKHIRLIFDTKLNLVFIDNTSKSICDSMFIWLKKNFSQLTFKPVTIEKQPKDIMRSLLHGESVSDQISLEGDCELKDDNSPAVVSIKNQELQTQSIQNLLLEKSVSKIALRWNDSVSFVLQDDLKISRLKFHDLEQAPDAENNTEKVDYEIAIYSPIYSSFTTELLKIFS
tara:strand:+ start:129 stop:983 length:855 start_codon:yes stop_codon:yes gene_type:complete